MRTDIGSSSSASPVCVIGRCLPKVVLLGDFGSGKSSLFRRLTRGVYTGGGGASTSHQHLQQQQQRQRATTVADVAATPAEACAGSAAIRLPDGTKAMLHDTCGLERYGRSLTHSYFRGAVCVVLVADATNLRSVCSLDDWNTDVECYAPEASKVLVINKSDSPVADTGLVSNGEIDSYRSRLDCFRSAIVSAKTGQGIDLLLQRIAEANQLHRCREAETATSHLMRSKFIQLQEKSEENSSEVMEFLSSSCSCS